MAAEINRQDVEHIARLSRLLLNSDEIERYQHELQSILNYMDQLGELNTTDVEPTAHPLPLHNVLRPDTPGESYDARQALQNAPVRDGSFFAVPAVLDFKDSS